MSCGPSQADKEADAQWNSFTSPALTLYELKGHVDTVIYDFYASNENGMKINKIKSDTIKFDVDGVCQSEVFIPQLWLHFKSNSLSYDDNGNIQAAFVKESFLGNARSQCKMTYKNGELTQIKTSDLDPNASVDYICIDISYDDNKWLGKASCMEYWLLDTRDRKTCTIENKYNKIDDNGNWIECLQKINDKYYLITRMITMIERQ